MQEKGILYVILEVRQVVDFRCVGSKFAVDVEEFSVVRNRHETTAHRALLCVT